MRPALRLLPALALLGCAAAKLCRIAQLTDLEGELSGRGGPAPEPSQPADGCAWHIRPGMWLRAIEFRALDVEITGDDQLSFYASAASRAGLVLRASAAEPLPSRLVLTGSSEVLVVLSAGSRATRLRLGYRCRPAGHRFGALYLPPATYVSVLAALAFLGLLACLLPAYALCRCWAKRRQPRPRPGQRPPEREDSRTSYLVTEQHTLVALEALPTKLWLEDSAEKPDGEYDAEQCCLCLEHFKAGDEVRVLPCEHYFHKVCVDRWFVARRFMPRTCPHCRRDPAAAGGPAASPCAAAPVPLGRPAAEDAQLTLPGAVPEGAVP